MFTSLTPEQALREKVELEAKVKYLRTQLGQLMQEKRGNLRSSRSTSKQMEPDASDDESNSLGESKEDVYGRRSRRHPRPQDQSHNDFKGIFPNLKVNLI